MDRHAIQIPDREDGPVLRDGVQRAGGAKNGVQAVMRAFRILDAIAALGGEATLTEIARTTALKTSTCHHLLATLIQSGYAAKRRGTRSYVLGSRILSLSNLCLKEINLPQRAQRIIETLNVQTREAVQLAVLQGDDLVTVMRKETLWPIRVDAGTEGKTDAAHATATGKAILAWLPEPELLRLVKVKGLRAFTPNTITDLSRLMEELRLVRRHGYAMDREEFQNGVCCIGATIRSASGTILGSISVSSPVYRANEKTIEQLQKQVVEAAQLLSADLHTAPELTMIIRSKS